MYSEAVALACIGWFVFIALVCAIGEYNLFKHYRRPPGKANVLSRQGQDVPHVTAIRPCKGYEPHLYECLAATFQQSYPASKLTVCFCVASRDDAAYSTILNVVQDHPDHDAKVYVEEDNIRLNKDGGIGPNPKIRNMSEAYRQAKEGIIWIIDCNIWVNPDACGRMVDKLYGYGSNNKRSRPYKLVHLLPTAVDVSESQSAKMLNQLDASYDQSPSSQTSNQGCFGGRLEELFLSSSHAKMYVAINVVAVAPCIVGKSTMFRRSHLDSLTNNQGIDFFSHNICEDHLIGDLLWRNRLPFNDAGLKYRNHGLVMGDLAIQPVAGMSAANYIARRVRWLRVRKFTVPVATLVEPGTESMLCSLMGAFGVTSSKYTKQIFGDTWTAMLLCWILSMLLWMSVDRLVYLLLHSGLTIETSTGKVPDFAEPLQQQQFPPRARRTWWSWAKAWIGRESLALPIWLWAIWGGVTVTWRDKRFWVGMDMRVHEVKEDSKVEANGHLQPGSASSSSIKKHVE